MPRLPIDYTKAVIYKIVCRDVSITEKYVGSTTDLTRRKSHHKSKCTNPKDKDYNAFVYRFIRDHGGFDNFDVVSVEENLIGCSDSPSLHTRERYWIEHLHAELNARIPTRTRKEHYEDNRDKISESNKKFYYLNHDKFIEYQRQYRELNRDKLIEYRKQKRDITNERVRKCRALKKATIY
jgi:hypothetical protein